MKENSLKCKNCGKDVAETKQNSYFIELDADFDVYIKYCEYCYTLDENSYID